MRKHIPICAAAAISLATPALAQSVRVIVAGEVAPGVYGRVDIGNQPPPPVLYPGPVLIVQPALVGPPLMPIYMHVPPGHAKNWAKHCRRYNACGQPVYFVKSAEYEPGYQHPGRSYGKGKGKGG